MTQFNVGDKVVIDDESGSIESVIVGSQGNKYDVRYGHTFMIAIGVPEDEIEPWVEDEQ
jgi:hypothetical protein